MITSLISGADAVEAQCKRFEVRASDGGKVLFSADEDEIVIGADRLKVTGMVVIKILNGYKHIFLIPLVLIKLSIFYKILNHWRRKHLLIISNCLTNQNIVHNLNISSS